MNFCNLRKTVQKNLTCKKPKNKNVLYKRGKAYSEDLRVRVGEFCRDHSLLETSRIFHVSVFFACKMKKLMDGKLAPLKRRRRSAKLTGAHVKWLIECLTEQPLMYLEEMQALLREKETDPIEVSKSTISRALKKAGFTKKKTQAIAKERESERVKELRRVYKEKMPSMNVHQMLFLDESGFNQKTKNRVRGWSHRGETIQSVQQYQKGQRYSLFAAIGLGSNGSRITTTMITKRNGNRIMFLKFLREKGGSSFDSQSKYYGGDG